MRMTIRVEELNYDPSAFGYEAVLTNLPSNATIHRVEKRPGGVTVIWSVEEE